MKKNKSEDAETEALMQEGVTQTVELAKENGVTLDFSDESIQHIENLLAECHREYKKVKSEDGFHGLAMMFGAYIGEVIRKKGFGGSWARNHPDMGENSFPFHWRGQDLFLYGWCAKRIFDGDADNVAFKYKALILDKLQ
ncbi:MAG: hypothetical protein JWQ71_2582 [Pedosphaera sp.]|nr:hypothetical protein [Pedosphaera sp.]